MFWAIVQLARAFISEQAPWSAASAGTGHRCGEYQGDGVDCRTHRQHRPDPAEAAIALLQIVVQRSLDYEHRLESFSMDNISRRLARTLIRFSQRPGSTAEQSRELSGSLNSDTPMRKRKYDFSMALRLQDYMNDLVTEAAHDRNVSKAAFIRAAYTNDSESKIDGQRGCRQHSERSRYKTGTQLWIITT
jgi:hypothetical protein